MYEKYRKGKKKIMFNIVYFEKEIKNLSSCSYKTYEKLYEENLLISPIIYTDNYDMCPNNIAIFSTFYIREIFNKKYILCDYDNYKFIPKNFREYCIVIDDQKNNIDLMRDCFLKIHFESLDTVVNIIKERILHETV